MRSKDRKKNHRIPDHVARSKKYRENHRLPDAARIVRSKNRKKHRLPDHVAKKRIEKNTVYMIM